MKTPSFDFAKKVYYRCFFKEKIQKWCYQQSAIEFKDFPAPSRTIVEKLFYLAIFIGQKANVTRMFDEYPNIGEYFDVIYKNRYISS